MPNNQEYLEDPIIQNEGSRSGQSKVLQPVHVDNIVYFSAIMISKTLLYTLIRYFYMSMNDNNESALIYNNGSVSVALLAAYFALIFMIHISMPQITRTTLNVLVGSVFLVELLFLLLTVFSNIIVVSATCIVIFFTFVIYHIKTNNNYSKMVVILMTIVIFIGGLVALEFTSRDYIKKADNGYLKVNAFLASFVFCLWSAFYFEDAENFETVDPVCTSFIFVLDSFIIIKRVLDQVKEEFYIYERDEKESDLVIDKPIE